MFPGRNQCVWNRASSSSEALSLPAPSPRGHLVSSPVQHKTLLYNLADRMETLTLSRESSQPDQLAAAGRGSSLIAGLNINSNWNLSCLVITYKIHVLDNFRIYHKLNNYTVILLVTIIRSRLHSYYRCVTFYLGGLPVPSGTTWITHGTSFVRALPS